MAKIRLLVLSGLGLMVLLMAGCATEPTRLEAYYGTSFQAAKHNQIFNPEAKKNLEPVSGFDGKAAANTIERYQDSFAKPPPAPQFVISVGQK